VPETLKRAEKRTERCNQHLAHSVKGSKRHALLVQKLERAYMHEANIKKDWREKLTTKLIAETLQLSLMTLGLKVRRISTSTEPFTGLVVMPSSNVWRKKQPRQEPQLHMCQGVFQHPELVLAVDTNKFSN
jgi:hypothetical protein